MMQSTMRSFGTTGSRGFVLPPPQPHSMALGCHPSLVVAFPSKSTSAHSRRRVMVSRRGVRCKLLQQTAPVPDQKANRNVDGSSATQGLKGRIAEAMANVTLSASPFDTAWVAMVPSPTSNSIPCFPRCLEWILQNQKLDGSWGLAGNYKYLVKDAILSTLACIVTLKKWNIGDELINRGIGFIGYHSSFLINNKQHSPVGFNVVFSKMLQHSKQLGIDIPISEDILSAIYVMRDIELKSKASSCQWKSYLGYIDDGVDPIHYYDEVKKRYQKDNGSLFNSPSATAAMLIHLQDVNAMNYLSNVVRMFGDTVPVVSPSSLCARLCMVDSLDKLGISHHFRGYVGSVLDETYRAWLQNEEELRTEVFTCALAFRLLRMHGYDISPDIFDEVDVDELLSYRKNSYPQTTTVLELYKASQLDICQNDNSLKKLKSWSTHFLTQSVENSIAHDDVEKHIIEEVKYNLDVPFYECLDHLKNRRNIETYNKSVVQCMKSSFLFHNIDGRDILELAINDFNFHQSIYQKELYFMKRWFQEKKLDGVAKYGLNGLIYSYLAAVTSVIPIECYDARIAWAKSGLLITVFDDFFDVTGSTEERANMIDLCQRWDSNYKTHCCSEKVYVLFDALYTTVEELGAKASSIHGYNVTDHIIELWVDVNTTMRVDAEWQYSRTTPTMEQYIENGLVSFGLGAIMLPAMYFVGEKLSWDIIRSKEYQQLFESVSIFGRLINDIAGFEREDNENKPTSVSLVMLKEHGHISEEDAKREVWNIIEANRNKLSKLVFKSEGSVVPRACKDLAWNVCRFLFCFYGKVDGLRSASIMETVKAIIDEPITRCS